MDNCAIAPPTARGLPRPSRAAVGRVDAAEAKRRGEVRAGVEHECDRGAGELHEQAGKRRAPDIRERAAAVEQRTRLHIVLHARRSRRTGSRRRHRTAPSARRGPADDVQLAASSARRRRTPAGSSRAAPRARRRSRASPGGAGHAGPSMRPRAGRAGRQQGDCAEQTHLSRPASSTSTATSGIASIDTWTPTSEIDWPVKKPETCGSCAAAGAPQRGRASRPPSGLRGRQWLRRQRELQEVDAPRPLGP